MGVAALIVGALCFVVLKEPEGSFADAHKDDDDDEIVTQESLSAKQI